jgi:hypothetical protein
MVSRQLMEERNTILPVNLPWQLDGQCHLEYRLPWLGFNAQLSVMFVDNGVGDMQSQSCALTRRFGGEERLEDALLDFGGDTLAVILDLNGDAFVF